ncbi:hypothetical protein B0H14DRAFT_2597331 [Mycena olivaceomarginata]|nr:hypothetical protein B0H14DRAFT_2597331 [Mycena olivaceomarginata]
MRADSDVFIDIHNRGIILLLLVLPVPPGHEAAETSAHVKRICRERMEAGELSEITDVLDLLFQFMYPQPQPDLRSLDFTVLAALAEAAEKYMVYPALASCRLQMNDSVCAPPFVWRLGDPHPLSFPSFALNAKVESGRGGCRRSPKTSSGSAQGLASARQYPHALVVGVLESGSISTGRVSWSPIRRRVVENGSRVKREANTPRVECAAGAMDVLCRCRQPYQNPGRVYCLPIHGRVVENGSRVEREGMTDIEDVGGHSGRARSTGGEAAPLPASSFLRDIEYARVERTSEALLATRDPVGRRNAVSICCRIFFVVSSTLFLSRTARAQMRTSAEHGDRTYRSDRRSPRARPMLSTSSEPACRESAGSFGLLATRSESAREARYSSSCALENDRGAGRSKGVGGSPMQWLSTEPRGVAEQHKHRSAGVHADELEEENAQGSGGRPVRVCASASKSSGHAKMCARDADCPPCAGIVGAPLRDVRYRGIAIRLQWFRKDSSHSAPFDGVGTASESDMYHRRIHAATAGSTASRAHSVLDSRLGVIFEWPEWVPASEESFRAAELHNRIQESGWWTETICVTVIGHIMIGAGQAAHLVWLFHNAGF